MLFQKEPGFGPKRPKKDKKDRKSGRSAKDPNAPKRPQTAYFLWMNENREDLKRKHPDLAVTELSKKAGEIWQKMSSKEKLVCCDFLNIIFRAKNLFT